MTIHGELQVLRASGMKSENFCRLFVAFSMDSINGAGFALVGMNGSRKHCRNSSIVDKSREKCVREKRASLEEVHGIDPDALVYFDGRSLIVL